MTMIDITPLLEGWTGHGDYALWIGPEEHLDSNAMRVSLAVNRDTGACALRIVLGMASDGETREEVAEDLADGYGTARAHLSRQAVEGLIRTLSQVHATWPSDEAGAPRRAMIEWPGGARS